MVKVESNLVAKTDFRITSKDKLSKIDALKNPGFYPSQEALLTLTKQNMSLLFLKQIDCYLANYLYRLTFVFSDNTKSPPAQTYAAEPTRSYTFE